MYVCVCPVIVLDRALDNLWASAFSFVRDGGEGPTIAHLAHATADILLPPPFLLCLSPKTGDRRYSPPAVRLHLPQRAWQQHHPPPQRSRQGLPPLLLSFSFRQFLPPSLLFLLHRHWKVHLLYLPLLPAGLPFLPPSLARTAHQRVLRTF